MSLLLALALVSASPEAPDYIGPHDCDGDVQCQKWFCEDYLANDEKPFPGCVWEGRRPCWRDDALAAFAGRFLREAPHLSAVIRAANENDAIIGNYDLSGNGEDVIEGLMGEARDALAIGRVNSCD